jgi:hypothetical protein
MVWRNKVYQNSFNDMRGLVGSCKLRTSSTFHRLYISTVRLNFAISCFSISFLSLHQHGLFPTFDNDAYHRKRVLGGVVAAMLRLLSLVTSLLPCASFRSIFCILSRRRFAFSRVVAFCSAAISGASNLHGCWCHIFSVSSPLLLLPSLVPVTCRNAGAASSPLFSRYYLSLFVSRCVMRPHSFVWRRSIFVHTFKVLMYEDVHMASSRFIAMSLASPFLE